jgi:hypothetical protein
MIMNKQKRSYGWIFILIIILVMVIMKVNTNNQNNLPLNREQNLPTKGKSNPSTEIETGGRINQTDQNAANESAAQKAGESEDRLFNKLMERDVLDTANKIDEDLELKKALESLKVTDRELMKKWDIPEDVLVNTSTDKSFLHFIQSPITTYITLYSKDEIGVQRLINASSTLHDFYMRKDLAEGAIKMYREYDFSPQSMSDESIIEKFSQDKKLLDDPKIKKSIEPNNIVNVKIGFISMNIMFADRTLLTPQFFPKLKGNEKEFLKVMRERYEKVSKLQEIYGEDHYGAAIAYLPLFCLRLAENLDKEFYTNLKDINTTSEAGKKQFFNEIKQYLEK